MPDRVRRAAQLHGDLLVRQTFAVTGNDLGLTWREAIQCAARADLEHGQIFLAAHRDAQSTAIVIAILGNAIAQREGQFRSVPTEPFAAYQGGKRSVPEIRPPLSVGERKGFVRSTR